MIKSNKLVHGMGSKGMEYPTCKNYESLKEYQLWRSMLFRCTKKQWDKYPTYTGVTCSENFKYYSFFYEWCQEQLGFKNIDANGKCWQLDKDILVKGNKVYSEDTCVFVPQRLNYLLLSSKLHRGEYPIGVYWNKERSKFQAICSDGYGRKRYLGRFDTPEEAFAVYKAFKEIVIKEVTTEYKKVLDYRVYAALMNYEVDIND